MHCHIEYHNEMGMALVMKEGDVTDMNMTPPDMQRCGSFKWSNKEFVQKVNAPKPPGNRSLRVPSSLDLYKLTLNRKLQL